MNAYSVNESNPAAVVVRKPVVMAYGAHTITVTANVHQCPRCHGERSRVIAQRGWYERTDLHLCECGQKFEVYG